MAFFVTKQTFFSSGTRVPWPVVFAILLGALMIFAHLGKLPLMVPDEGRNAEVAREMNLSNAWLAPSYNGVTYLDKPAFYFKTVALSFALFGESEATARLSSAAFGFSLLVALFLFCRRVYDERTATLAVVVVATTPLYMAFSRLVIFDMTLAFFVSSAIFACYLAEECQDKRRNYWYLAGALSAGIATLVKGPVGFLIPSLVIGIFNWADGREGAMKRCFNWPNWIVFFAVVLPWFVGLSLECPDFPYYGIMKESISRFASKEFHRAKPFYFYALIIASCFFAWSLLLPESMLAAWRARSRWSRADRLFVVWSITVVVFFSISQSKLPGYILTATIALGVLTARVFADALNNSEGTGARIVRHGTMALALLSAVAAFFMLALVSRPETMGQGLRIKPQVLEALWASIPGIAGSFAAVAILSASALFSKAPKWAFAAFLSVPLLLLTVNFNALSSYAERFSSRRLAKNLPPQLSADTEIACLECLPNGLPFYSKRLVTVVSKDGSEFTSNYVLFTLSSGKEWPGRIVPLNKRDAWLAARDRPVYLLADGKNLSMLQGIAEHYGAQIQELAPGYWSALLPKPKDN